MLAAQFEQRAALAARDTRVGARSFEMRFCAYNPGRRRAFAEPVPDAMPAQAPIAGTRLAGAAPARSPAVRRQSRDAEAMDLGDDRVGRDAMS
jgi:hypothetical protein